MEPIDRTQIGSEPDQGHIDTWVPGCAASGTQMRMIVGASASPAAGVHVQWLLAHRWKERVQGGQPSQAAGDFAEAVHGGSALHGDSEMILVTSDRMSCIVHCS